jgi:hypothetical protein
VVTEAPTDDPTAEGGTLPDIDEEGLHSFVTTSYAYPSGHVQVGSTVVVGVVKPSQLVLAQRTYAIANRSAAAQLTFL